MTSLYIITCFDTVTDFQDELKLHMFSSLEKATYKLYAIRETYVNTCGHLTDMILIESYYAFKSKKYKIQEFILNNENNEYQKLNTHYWTYDINGKFDKFTTDHPEVIHIPF